MTSDDRFSGLVYLNEEEAETIDAIAARLIPGDPTSPGAREANVLVYIDRALSGYFDHLQTFYRWGILKLDDLSLKLFGSPFRQLSETQQDNVLQKIDGKTGSETSGLAEFFAVVREHTLEGFLCDPIYGGNKDGVGWKLIGFPGA